MGSPVPVEEFQGLDKRGDHALIGISTSSELLSSLDLNTARLESSTTFLSNLFQSLTTLTVEDHFLTSNLDFLSFNLYPLLLFLSLQFLTKSVLLASLQAPSDTGRRCEVLP